jgi:hypothetical protein
MTNHSSRELYRKYFSDRNFERLDLFQIIADKYGVQRVLYPGSFVHITPSFVFPVVVYVDTDRQAKRFFSTAEMQDIVAQRKSYPQDAQISFHFADYRDGCNEESESFDLLVSQYAGFVGQYCKHYLKKGGLLLANNSHGDAGIAAIDEDYALSAVVFLQNGKHQISETNLAAYFVPKSSALDVTRDYLIGLQKGISYKKSGSAYLFQRLR